VLYAQALEFNAARLASNRKRLTNKRQQAAPGKGPFPHSDALHALLAAAAAESERAAGDGT